MKEHMLNPSDEILMKNGEDLVVTENEVFIKIKRENKINQVKISTLSPRDIFLILFKSKFYYFSRYYTRNDLIQTFQDLKEIFDLKSQIEELDNIKIAKIMKYIDPNDTFKFACGATLYKNNFDGEEITLDDVVNNLAQCREKRTQEDRPPINPITGKKIEEENA